MAGRPPNQASLDFGGPPPRRPLTREIDRSTWFPVATLPLRASAALVDLAIIMAFCAIFTASVRTTLGQLPVSVKLAPFYAAAFVVVAAVYKLTWGLVGQNSPGLRAAGLRVVSFDGYAPSLQQLLFRQTAGFFSVAAAGMGLAWALGDQETLTWHDHMSQTFVTDAPLPER